MAAHVLIKFEAYLLTEKRVAHNTFAAYKRDIEQFEQFLHSKNKEFDQSLSPEDIKDFLQELHNEQLHASSIARKISALKTLFQYVHQHLSWPNHAEHIIFPKIEKRLPKYLSEQEIEQLFIAAENDRSDAGIRNKVMLYLLYVSGMRISELTKLKRSNIHFDTGFIAITGKGGKGRMIPLPQGMLVALKEYMQTVHSAFVAKGRQTDYLFPIIYAGKIKPISRQALWGILNDLWEKTGIKKNISPHQLRHSFATHMLKNGANLRSLQLLLGHENLSTVQIYTHVEKSYARNIYDKKHPRS